MTTELVAPRISANWWLVLVQGIATLILGVFLVMAPAMTTAVLVLFLGVYWLVTGVVTLVSLFVDQSKWGWKLISGILGIVVGLLVLQHPMWSTALIPTTLVIILGIQALIVGVSYLVRGFSEGWGTLLLGALNLIIGAILLFNYMAFAIALPVVLGILAVVGGILLIVSSFGVRGQANTEVAA